MPFYFRIVVHKWLFFLTAYYWLLMFFVLECNFVQHQFGDSWYSRVKTMVETRLHGRSRQWTKDYNQFQRGYRIWWEWWQSLQGKTHWPFFNAQNLRQVHRFIYASAYLPSYSDRETNSVDWLSCRVLRLRREKLRSGFLPQQWRHPRNYWCREAGLG